MDGRLDDPVWSEAPAADGFVVSEPAFGQPASQDTRVRVVYTDEAIYVGAYLYDEPDLVRRQLTERDNELGQDTDKFAVGIDTYRDRQNAFMFVVTPPNVQSDLRVSSGTANSEAGTNFDPNWDAVWDSRTALTGEGWCVEMRIPFSAIRFPEAEVQTWGINFWRYIRRLNEYDYWNPLNPGEAGFVNQFGDLTGLQDIVPPLRLSFLPYVSAGLRQTPYAAGDRLDGLRNGGMDVKYGINESFTLDMTLIPDFGQVRSDDIILNLSPFEQVFAENRPFFTEGTELFNRAELFYSRRIGSRPAGFGAAVQLAADSSFLLRTNPAVSRLVNAVKLSGRTAAGTGIGFFNAVTAPAEALLERPDGSVKRLRTAPLTNYNILVVDQSLRNRSFLTFTNTNVRRADDARDANVAALTLSLFDRHNRYNLQAQGSHSALRDTNLVQGARSALRFGKVGGTWQWSVGTELTTDRYDHNDLGVLLQGNQVIHRLSGSYNQFVPRGVFNARTYSLALVHTSRYAPHSFSSLSVEGQFYHLFRNFWSLSWVLFSQPTWENDYFELRRPGRSLRRWPFVFNLVTAETDSRKALLLNAGTGYGMVLDRLPDAIEDKTWGYYLSFLGLRYRFGPRLIAETGVEAEWLQDGLGWVFNDPDRSEPAVGLRKTRQITTTSGLVYSFMARMSLNVRMRHYWSQVRYRQFFQPDERGNLLPYPFAEGWDNHFNAFNLDAFFTWDFKPGSRFILAWKNTLGPDSRLDGLLTAGYFPNFRGVFGIPHTKEATVKFIYFLDAVQFSKHTPTDDARSHPAGIVTEPRHPPAQNRPNTASILKTGHLE